MNDTGAAAGAATGGTAGTGGQPAGATAGAVLDAVKGTDGAFTVPPDMMTWANSKGYKDFDKKAASDPDFYRMAKSYQDTEKWAHSNKGNSLALPKDANDTEGWNNVFKAIGRPENADGYKLPMPEGVTDTPMAKQFRQVFFDAGLGQQQAEKLTTAFNAYETQVIQQYETDIAAKAAQDGQKLKTEWGGNEPRNMEAAKRGFAQMAKSVGLEEGDLKLLEGSIGLYKTMKIMNQYAEALHLVGDTFEGGAPGQRTGAGMTVQQAESQKEALMNDPGFFKKYREGDADAREKLRKLNAIIAPSRTS